MRWSEPPLAARLRCWWLEPIHRDPCALSAAVAHLGLVRPMIFQNQTLLLIVGTIFPILFAAFVFFDPRRIYAPWAKLASVFVAIAGLGWGTLVFLLMDPQRLHATRDVYFVLLAFRNSLEIGRAS